MRRWWRCALLVIALSGVLAACGRDKGDPVKISREFMVGNWRGDVARVEALTCRDWREVTTGWAATGDPSVLVDTEHLTFDITFESNSQVEVVMGGLVTFKSPDGQTAVTNFDESGRVRFLLIDEDGWKVCDVRDLD
jgi:hypothetical protein